MNVLVEGIAIGYVAGGVLRFVGRKLDERREARAREVKPSLLVLPCTTAGCLYSRGHLQPCWDGKPAPGLLERL